METTQYIARKPRKSRKKKEMISPDEPKSRKRLIAEADLWASRAIRLRDMESDGLVPCFTCEKRLTPKAIQNGHFVGRAHYSVRYDPRNMHAQCTKCNTYRSGEPGMYALNLIKQLGVPEFMDLLQQGTNDCTPSDEDLVEIANEFRTLTNRLLVEKSVRPWW